MSGARFLPAGIFPSRLFAGGPGSSDSGVGDSSESAVERVHRLISELSDSVAAVDEINERVSNELDWRRLHSQSRQVRGLAL